MHVLVGIASPAPDADRRVAQACDALAAHGAVLALSRAWSAPAQGSDRPGVLRAAHVDVALRPQDTRPWLWDLEGDGSDVQFELLAGRHHGRWRWGIDLDRDGAWGGPLADIVPDLRLPGGMTVRDHVQHHPHPGAEIRAGPPSWRRAILVQHARRAPATEDAARPGGWAALGS